MAVVAAKRYRVELASPEQLGALVSLYADAEAEQGRTVDEPERDRFGQWLLEALYDANARVWVAMIGRRAVGFRAARLVDFPFGRYQHFAHGVALYVRPESRGDGIARALDQAMTQWAGAHQAPLLGQCEPGVLAMWEKLGWRTVGHTIVKEP